MKKKIDSRFRGNDVKRTKREPRWVIAFLRALERCGHARASANDAGIDHTTAYQRRKAHGDFADAWAAALAAHRLRRKREEAEELEAFVGRLPSPGSPVASPTSPAGGSGEEELVLVNGRMKRVGREQWGKRKEKLFFDELMATNNIRRAAKAAGVSENAMHQRRLKHPLFRAKWEAVEQCCKAGFGMYLLEATRNTFDPGALEVGGITPKVSIAEAIRILGSGSKAAHAAPPDRMAEAVMEAEAEEELRERVVRKLMRLGERLRTERVEQGWAWDEQHGQTIPPGWMRGSGPEASA
jgi:hypothetical protein